MSLHFGMHNTLIAGISVEDIFFQNRYRSILVEDSVYLKRLLRYVHLNPVDAELVSQPEKYRWSSFRAYIQKDEYVWLQTERVLRKFGNTPEEAKENLLKYTYQKVDAEFDKEAIYHASRKGIFGDEVLQEYVFQTEESKSVSIQSKEILPLKEFLSLVCVRLNVTKEELTNQSKNTITVDARSILALVSRKYHLWPLQEVATLLNKSSGTISRLATRAEKKSNLLTIAHNLYVELIN